MKVTVLLFAGLKDALGRDRVEVEVEDGADAGSLWSAIEENWPQTSDYRGRVAFAVGDCLVPATESLEDGSEVALLPPVSGG